VCEPLVGSIDHLVQPRCQDVRRKPHLQLVVGAHAADELGHRLRPDVVLAQGRPVVEGLLQTDLKRLECAERLLSQVQRSGALGGAVGRGGEGGDRRCELRDRVSVEPGHLGVIEDRAGSRGGLGTLSQ
jgi:hypothetical protein